MLTKNNAFNFKDYGHKIRKELEIFQENCMIAIHSLMDRLTYLEINVNVRYFVSLNNSVFNVNYGQYNKCSLHCLENILYFYVWNNLVLY